MPDHFVTQTILQLKLRTEYDLSGATWLRIYYRKPDDTTGFFPATASGKFMVYDVQPGDIDQVGKWQFQAKMLKGGEEIQGSIAYKEFKTPIT